MAATGYIQQTRQISLMLFSYAMDNQGAYPAGQSSTEIFQRLLDENYCTDSSAFYVPMPGKRAPVAGQKLKPENVSFDVTTGANLHSPSGLPLVFMTGYVVNYAPNGTAASKHHVPIYSKVASTLWHSWDGWPGLAVNYVGKASEFEATWLKGNYLEDGGAIIPHFVPSDFNPTSGHYQQLTPDGPRAANGE
jgi:hypothetical protein